MEAIEFVLTIYSWVIVGILVVFLWRVAFFYEKTSGQRVGYRVLIFPALLLTAGVVWYLVYDVEFAGESTADLLLFGGGVLLGLFGIHLQQLMTGERR